MVHEIGHNLGMMHDFDGNVLYNRYADEDETELCTGVGGYMDYFNDPNQWSKCSVNDFTTYYNDAIELSGEFCLKLSKNTLWMNTNLNTCQCHSAPNELRSGKK